MLNAQSWINHVVYELSGGTLFRTECVGKMPVAGEGLRLDPSLYFNAKISRSTHVISINLGVISTLTAAALSVAGDRRFICSILHSESASVGDFRPFHWKLDQLSEDVEVVGESWNCPLPNLGTPEWFVFANVFYGALRFVLLHEQAHLIQGHVAFSAELGFADDFIELNAGGADVTLDPHMSLRRFLEHDADRFAYHFLLRPFVPYIEGGIPGRLRKSLLDGDPRFVSTFCGSCICFAILNKLDSDGRHPSALFRLRQALVNLQSTINFKSDFSKENIDHITANLVDCSGAMFSRIGILDEAFDAWKTSKKMPDDHKLAAERTELILLGEEVYPKLSNHQAALGDMVNDLFWGGVQA